MVNAFTILDLLASQIPHDIFLVFEIGMMIIIAGIVGYILKLMKQPLIPAYIIAGILLGPLGANLIQNTEVLVVLSEIGVAFLLFFAGIEMNLKKLKEVGKTAAVTGTIQILILFFAGFLVSVWLGLTGRAPIYVGLIVAFSSTMIVLKLLAEKRELNSLHGRIIIGILLIQDIAAIIALTIFTTDLTVINITNQLLKALGFVIVAMILAKIINPIFRTAAKSTELLLLTAMTLLFIFAIGSYVSGLSLIIGAFVAGLVLANSDYRIEIQGRIMPLRDFFAILFFVALGMQLTLFSQNFVFLLIALFILVLILKPLIIMFLTRTFGYANRTSFLTGNALAQTSEFSLIIATIGLTLGYLSQELFSSLVLLTIVTMAATTYLIQYDKRLFHTFSFPLNIFKSKGEKESLEFFTPSQKKIVIFGCHRIGSLFLKYFAKRKKEVLVIDFDPDIIRSLINKKISCIYGDFANREVLEKADLKHAEIIISTIPDLEDNVSLIKKVRVKNKKVITFVTANIIDEAEQLYKAGADYVLLPKVITGEHGFKLARDLLNNKRKIKKLRSDQIKELKNIHHLLYEK